MPVLTQTQLDAGRWGKIHPSQWTAIVPAAGRGSRLNYELPKAFFPLNGKPLVQWVIDKVKPIASNIVLVVSQQDASLFDELIKQQPNPEQFAIAFQHQPRGTVDAVLSAESLVRTRHCLVIWGDHYSVFEKTVRISCEVHAGTVDAVLTLPTCHRARPYIAVRRDASGTITEVLQARELGVPPAHGENDCGCFCFNTRSLFAVLHRAVREDMKKGAVTGELNLLSLLPAFSSVNGVTTTLQIGEIAETLGVNTPSDAEQARDYLLRDAWKTEKTKNT